MPAKSRTTYEWRMEPNGQFRMYEVTTTETPLGESVGIFNYRDLFGNILIKSELPTLSYLEQLEAEQRARASQIEYIETPSYLRDMHANKFVSLRSRQRDMSLTCFEALEREARRTSERILAEEREMQRMMSIKLIEHTYQKIPLFEIQESKWDSLGILDTFEQARQEDEARRARQLEEAQLSWLREEAERKEREEERRRWLKPNEDESDKYYFIIKNTDKWK